MLYKISPSDLAYLWDCPRCFWRKAHGKKRPDAPFPLMFNQIDRAQRKAFHELRLADGSWLDTTNLRVTSYPLLDLLPDGTQPPHNLYVLGNLDIIHHLTTDGLIAVEDFKTHKLSPESQERYRRQLHGYAHALEHPQKGEVRRVDHLSLRCWEPTHFTVDETLEHGSLHGDFTMLDMPHDPAWFNDFLLHDVLGLLAGNEPDMETAAKTCGYCNWEAMILSAAAAPHVERIEGHV